MSLTSPYASIELARLELTLEALEPIPLAGFIGPTLRGMLGTALWEVSCDAQGRPAWSDSCLYREVFEAPRPLPGEQNPPPPFVLHAPAHPIGRMAPGQPLTFGLTLFGQAIRRAPAILWALFRHGLSAGLSRERRRYLLLEARATTPTGSVVLFRSDGGPVPESWDPSWTWKGSQIVSGQLETSGPAPSSIELQLTSPLDLREDKRPVRVLEFQHIARSLLRNVSAHARHHAGEPLDIDFSSIKQAAGSVRKVMDATDWLDLQHHSYRQDRTIPVQARIGRVVFEGELAPFLPLLALGQAIHVGKGRTMGFGGMAWRGL